MTYKVFDLGTKKCISNDNNSAIVLKPNGRIAYNEYGDEIGIPNCVVIFFPNENNDNYYIDEAGGVHDSGCGWDPNREYCGECSHISCSVCGVWNRIKD